jgi:lysozyme
MTRRINSQGLDIIKRFEGLKLRAYRCPAGVWTIGYGSTRDVHPGAVIAVSEAVERLGDDLKGAASAVERLVRVPLNDNEFGALVSIVFNIGAGAFEHSTLLRKLNSGDRAGAANEFKRWNRGGGRVLAGLVRRRAAENALFRDPPAHEFVSDLDRQHGG